METAEIKLDKTSGILVCRGNWTLRDIDSLKIQWLSVSFSTLNALVIDATSLTRLDSAGALFLQKLINELHDLNISVNDFLASKKVKAMLALIKKNIPRSKKEGAATKKTALLFHLGKATEQKWLQCTGFIALIGELCVRFSKALFNVRRLHLSSVVSVMDHAGLRALPILALLSALIGVVLTYQMGLQLKEYGVNIYIVYYCGIALQREFAPLITAIIVAGRTSSAFTAQLGSMKINEELDALTTMGLPPTELLVLPKVIGLFLVFPLLVFWADVFSTLGSMLMSKWTLDVGYVEYIQYLKHSLGVNEYLLGMLKAPVFALIIALVGCYQGFLVENSANSVGVFTTKSVVQAIFLIIVADAIFSFVYSGLGI